MNAPRFLAPNPKRTRSRHPAAGVAPNPRSPLRDQLHEACGSSTIPRVRKRLIGNGWCGICGFTGDPACRGPRPGGILAGSRRSTIEDNGAHQEVRPTTGVGATSAASQKLGLDRSPTSASYPRAVGGPPTSPSRSRLGCGGRTAAKPGPNARTGLGPPPCGPGSRQAALEGFGPPAAARLMLLDDRCATGLWGGA